MPQQPSAAVAVLAPQEQMQRIQASLRPDDNVQLFPARTLEAALVAPALVIVYDADSHHRWPHMLRRILDVRPAARVVLLSRRADSNMWVEALDAGAYDLLPKSSAGPEIRSVVLGALSVRYTLTAGATSREN